MRLTQEQHERDVRMMRELAAARREIDLLAYFIPDVELPDSANMEAADLAILARHGNHAAKRELEHRRMERGGMGQAEIDSIANPRRM